MNHFEHDNQVAVFKWAALMEKQEPRLKWLYAIPNSARRSPRQGAWMKAEGLKKGIWDIHLPVPTYTGGIWKHGLYVEMKTKGNKLTKEQCEFFSDNDKYFVFEVCFSHFEAISAIKKYLGI